MLELILKVTRNGDVINLISEDGRYSRIRFPEPDELAALGEDNEMYAVYQHGETFSRRMTPKREW